LAEKCDKSDDLDDDGVAALEAVKPLNKRGLTFPKIYNVSRNEKYEIC
jgi:hypothetical protein